MKFNIVFVFYKQGIIAQKKVMDAPKHRCRGYMDSIDICYIKGIKFNNFRSKKQLLERGIK